MMIVREFASVNRVSRALFSAGASAALPVLPADPPLAAFLASVCDYNAMKTVYVYKEVAVFGLPE